MNKGGEYNTMTARAIIESLTAERDALREVVRGVASVASERHLGPWLLGINAERYCGYCSSTYSVHEPTCVWTAMIALAQPTDAGGA